MKANFFSQADTTEPETDGANKFSFNHKGAKHSFKAASTAERNSWVAQLKAKIAEAKELAATVTESEAYKTALESFKPAPKEEKPAEEVKAEEPAVPEAAAAAEGETAPIATEAKPVEEPKSRSASRKRASIFGFGKKDSFKEKKEEVKSEEPVATETAEPVAEPVAQPAAIAEPVAEPVVEAAKTEETPAETEVAPAVEEKPTEEVESPKEKPTVSKRNSIFGGVFAKKDKKVVEPTKATDETVKEGEVSTDAAAPVIPPVESTTPLNAEEVNAAGENVATPASAAEPAVKKDVKEKRKSSLPFAFGRREKSPSPVDGEEKTEKADKRTSQSPFSKLRATIKGKSGAKAEEKPVGEAVKEESAATETAAAAAPEAETAASAEPVKVAEAETENKPENVASTTPAVTAAA